MANITSEQLKNYLKKSTTSLITGEQVYNYATGKTNAPKTVTEYNPESAISKQWASYDMNRKNPVTPTRVPLSKTVKPSFVPQELVTAGKIGKAKREYTSQLDILNQQRTALNLPTLTELPTSMKEEIKLQNENQSAFDAYDKLINKISPFKAPTTSLDRYALQAQEQPVKTRFQNINEHLNKYTTDSQYKLDYDSELTQNLARKVISENNKSTMGAILNDVMAFQGNFIDGLTSGALSSKLLKTVDNTYRQNIPNYKQTLQALTEQSPALSGIANVVGAVAGAMAMQNIVVKSVMSGASLSSAALNSKYLSDTTKFAIGVTQQIPQSFFSRDSYNQLWKEKGDVAFEIARNGISWLAGGRLETAMQNAIDKTVTNPVLIQGLKQNFIASILSKAPILERVATESAETFGQTVADIAFGKTEYLTDPSFMLQNVGMDMLMLTVSGLLGIDGNTKSAMLKDIKKLQKDFDYTATSAYANNTDLDFAKTEAMDGLNKILTKYNIQNDQIKQVKGFMNYIFSQNKTSIESEAGQTLSDAGKLYETEKTISESIASDQTLQTAPKFKDPEVLLIETENALKQNPPSTMTADELSELKLNRVELKDDSQEFAKSMKDLFGVDIQFIESNNPTFNKSYYGFYNPATNAISINARSEFSREAVIMHEVIHSMKINSPESYAKLQEIVSNTARMKSKEFNSKFLKAEQIKQTGQKESTVEMATEEYLADVALNMFMFEGGKMLDNVVKKDQSTFRIIMNNLKRAISYKGKKSPEIIKSLDSVSKMINNMDKALKNYSIEQKGKVQPEVKVEKPIVEAVVPPTTVPEVKVEELPIEKPNALKKTPKAVEKKPTEKKSLKKAEPKKVEEPNPVKKSLEKELAKSEITPTTPKVTNIDITNRFSTMARYVHGKVNGEMVTTVGKKNITKAEAEKSLIDAWTRLNKKPITKIQGAVDGLIVDVISASSKDMTVKMPDGTIKTLPLGEVELPKSVDRNMIPKTEETVKFSEPKQEPTAKKTKPMKIVKNPKIEQAAYSVQASAKALENEVVYNRVQEAIDAEQFDRIGVSSLALKKKYDDKINDPENGTSNTQDIYDQIIGKFNEKASRLTSDDYSAAIALMEHYTKTKNDADMDKLERVYTGYIHAMSEQGRGLQAARLLAKATPIGFRKYIDYSLRKLNEMGRNKYGSKWNKVELTEAEIAQIMNTNTDDFKAREYVKLKIGQRVASEMPRNFFDYLNAWRKLSMLSSARTHIRNISSNLLFTPIRAVDNAIGATIENAIKLGKTEGSLPWDYKASLDEFDRGITAFNRTARMSDKNWQNVELDELELDKLRNTNPNNPEAVTRLKEELRSSIESRLPSNQIDYFKKDTNFDKAFDRWVETGARKADYATTHSYTRNKELNNMIASDFEMNVKPTIAGKLNTDTVSTRNVFGVGVKPFGNEATLFGKSFGKFANWAAEKNSWLLNDIEDIPFYGHAYRMALGRYMKTNNLTEITPTARTIAMKNAMDATFKQNYQLVNLIEYAKRTKGTGVFFNNAIGTAVDTVVPFVRTPINIVMQGVKHSPFSIANGIAKAIKYKTGDTKAFEYKGKVRTRGDIRLIRESIDDLSTGLSGTGLMMLGVLLFNNGLVTAPPEEDYKLAQYRRDVGESPYALHLFGKYYPLNWVQPSIIPMITGITMAKSASDKQLDFDGMFEAGIAGTDVVFQLPFMSTLKDLLTGKGDQSQTKALTGAANTMIQSYIAQLTPTLIGDLAKSTDIYQRSTFTPELTSAELEQEQNAFSKLTAFLPASVRTTARKMMAKIVPQMLEKKIDMWGNDVKKTDTMGGNIAMQMISPMIVTKDKRTAVDNELIRIASKYPDEKTLYPSLSPLYVQNTFNGETVKVPLSAKAYTQWQITAGQTSYKTLDKIIDTKAYANSTDELKMKAYEMSHTYAKAKANNEVLAKNGMSGAAFTSEDDKINDNLIELYLENKKLDSSVTVISYPRTADDTITYNEKEYSMTQPQKNEFESALTTATRESVSKVINNTMYKALTPQKRYEKVQEALLESRKKAVKTFMFKNKSKLTLNK